MKPEIKEKWLEALRGGRFTQGKGKLRDENQRHCCLGVLCEISGRGRFNDDNEYVMAPDAVVGDLGYGRNAGVSYLPVLLAEEVGLGFVAQRSLSNLNDGGATFARIAEYIEERF